VLRLAFYQAGNAARRVDPQLAAIYHRLMVTCGHCHTQATVAVARKLVERTWTVLDRGQPYQLRDPDGQPITAWAAKMLITEQFTVPDTVRARAAPTVPPPTEPNSPADKAHTTDSIPTKAPPTRIFRRDHTRPFLDRCPVVGVKEMSTCSARRRTSLDVRRGRRTLTSTNADTDERVVEGPGPSRSVVTTKRSRP
jgi:hypothetical protein